MHKNSRKSCKGSSICQGKCYGNEDRRVCGVLDRVKNVICHNSLGNVRRTSVVKCCATSNWKVCWVPDICDCRFWLKETLRIDKLSYNIELVQWAKTWERMQLLCSFGTTTGNDPGWAISKAKNRHATYRCDQWIRKVGNNSPIKGEKVHSQASVCSKQCINNDIVGSNPANPIEHAQSCE